MTTLLLPFKLIKIWLYRFISTLLFYDETENREFIKPKIHKTRILPKVGNMALLPNPGKPGFYGVGLPGRVISCQPCLCDNNNNNMFFPGFQFVSVHTFIVKISHFLKNIRTNNIVP